VCLKKRLEQQLNLLWPVNKFMTKLSDHFNNEDFMCRCDFCKGETFRIHLGLVGILEMIWEHFKKEVIIGSAYWCEKYFESLNRSHKTYHTSGKAAHIKVQDVDIKEVFKFAETIPGINGIGLYPKDEFIHLDTRPEEKKESWIKEGESYNPLTPEKRKQCPMSNVQ